MGKRARSAHRAESRASTRPTKSTTASRKSRDASIDERMDAITAQSKYSQPRVTRVTRGRRAADEEDVPEDDIDRFHRQRDFVPLDPRADQNERDEDEDDLAHSRVLDLPDREEEEEEEEDEEEGEGEEDEVDDDGAFRPIPVDDLLDEDDTARRERSLAAERRTTTAWGRQKRAYYSADTVDFELESDEEIAAAEEEEATRMRQETLAQRKPADYTLGELLLLPRPSVSQSAVLPSAAASFSSLLDVEGGGDEGVVERVERVDDLSEEEKLRLMVQRVPEVLGLLEDLKARMEEVREVKSRQKGKRTGLQGEWLRTAELVLLMYASSGLMFLLLKGEGKAMQTHPINQQLLALRMQLTRLMALKPRFLDGASQPQPSAALTTSSVATKAQRRAKRVEAEEKQPSSSAVLGAAEENVFNAEDVEDIDEDADEEEEEKEEAEPARLPPPTRRKVDIFSSLPKPSSKPRVTPAAAPAAAAPTKPMSAFSASFLDDADDDGDLPLIPLPKAKKAKVLPTIQPTSLPPSLHPPTPSDADADVDADDDDGLAFYNQVAQARKAKLTARLHPPVPPSSSSIPPPSADVVDGKRAIGRLIEKNEGLKASRPRDRKTPKTRNRARYEKAMIKRRSQVREYKGQGGVYGGEATGIKRNVAKSVRIAG